MLDTLKNNKALLLRAVWQVAPENFFSIPFKIKTYVPNVLNTFNYSISIYSMKLIDKRMSCLNQTV